MGEKEYRNASKELREAMCRLNEKLDKMFCGDVVYDTMIRHTKQSIKDVVNNNELLDTMVKYCPNGIYSEFLLYLFAVMNAGPLPKELQTKEFRKGIGRFAKENACNISNNIGT